MKTFKKFTIYAAVIAILWLLTSCGGSSTSGGSGIGGTGITSVRGNVVSVVAQLRFPVSDQLHARLLAAVLDFISTPVIAQSSVSGIRVNGGGQAAITDETGRFALDDVAPDRNFLITLTLSSGQAISLGIGSVPEGALVQVNNIVIDTTQGSAAPDSIEVEEFDDDSKDDDSVDNDGSGSGGDDDSTDSDSSGSGSGGDDDSTDSDNSGSGSSNSGSG